MQDADRRSLDPPGGGENRRACRRESLAPLAGRAQDEGSAAVRFGEALAGGDWPSRKREERQGERRIMTLHDRT